LVSADTDGRAMPPAPVRLARVSPSIFVWEVDCPACGEVVFESVLWKEADCERCGGRVRVDLLQMRVARVEVTGT
jgi:rRNA maturation endonuclease Nob1